MPPCLNLLTKKAPYKGLSADSEEKHEPVSDINTAVVDSLKALDPNRPIREATEFAVLGQVTIGQTCRVALRHKWIFASIARQVEPD